METIYEKKRKSHEVLIEYYAYHDLRSILKKEWETEDQRFQKHCDKLYSEYEKLKAEEKRIEKSKSAKIEKKLEALKKIKPDYSDTVLLKKLKKS